MAQSKGRKLDRDLGASDTNSQELQDQLGHLLYQKTCEIIRDPARLSLAMQVNFSEITAESTQSPIHEDKFAESILADDAETVGRLVIDRVINVAWAMAERELGLTISESNVTPLITFDKTH